MSSEQIKKRNKNRYEVLRAIQSLGPLRRSEIAERCGIRKSSVTGLVDELLQHEIVCNRDPERPRSPLTYTSGKWFACAASVFEEDIQFARVDLKGDIFDRFSKQLPDKTPGGFKRTLIAGLKKLIEIDPGRSLGAGVSTPGIVDPVEGVCRCSINYPQLNNIEVKKLLKEKLDVDAVVQNDVRASLWAGIWFEQFLADYSNAIYLDITSGIGSALLMDGRLHAGASYAAGELGHMKAGDENRPCRCGRIDCLEAHCTIDAIRNDILAVAPELKNLRTAADIAAEAESNIVVSNVLDRAVERISRLLSVLVAYIDPEVILLGNQDPSFYEVIVPMLKKHLLMRLQGCLYGEVDIKIVPSATDSALRGIAGLVIEKSFREYSL